MESRRSPSHDLQQIQGKKCNKRSAVNIVKETRAEGLGSHSRDAKSYAAITHRVIESSQDLSSHNQCGLLQLQEGKMDTVYELSPAFIEDPDEDEARKTALKRISPSFTDIHQRLLDLAIGKCKLNQERVISIPPKGPLSSEHLRSMADMVEMEFIESLEKELNDPEEKSVVDPMPFDIFLMNPSLYHQCNDLHRQLAVCVPTKKQKGDQEKAMMWYDGRGTLWNLAPETHRQKVASLSGMARVLETLRSPPTELMKFAMSREMIMDSNDVPRIDGAFNSSDLNDSQMEAVLTVSSPAFDAGIFCVLGMIY
jgi:hypothetical protein